MCCMLQAVSYKFDEIYITAACKYWKPLFSCLPFYQCIAKHTESNICMVNGKNRSEHGKLQIHCKNWLWYCSVYVHSIANLNSCYCENWMHTVGFYSIYRRLIIHIYSDTMECTREEVAWGYGQDSASEIKNNLHVYISPRLSQSQELTA